MPPWVPPNDYCNNMSGTVASGPSGGWPAIKTFGGSWTSDNVFCMAGAATFWQTCLYIAIAFWGFFTVLQLFTTFDIQHSYGHALGRAVQHLLRQIILFFLACGSFFMMLLVHQLVWLIENAVVGGGIDQWRVDGIWLGTVDHPGATQIMMFAQLAMGTPGFFDWVGGGNWAGTPSIFTNTLPQIFYGLGSVQDTLLQATGSIRFVVMLLLVGTAPLAIISSGFHQFRTMVFRRWLELWLELEGLAILTALAISGFARVGCGQPNLGRCLTSDNIRKFLQSLISSMGPGGNTKPDISIIFPNLKGMDSMQLIFLMLAFTAIICGLQLAYIWNLIGNLITMGTGMYEASYNRGVATAKAGENAVAGALEIGGAILSVAGAPEVGIPMMIGGAAVKSVGDTAMSAIPQANGYGGNTMAALPDHSGSFQDVAGGGGDGGSGGDGGGGGGGSGGPYAMLSGGPPNTTTRTNISNRGITVVASRYRNTATRGAGPVKVTEESSNVVDGEVTELSGGSAAALPPPV